MNKQMVKHKLLEQKYKNMRHFARQAPHMFYFDNDDGWGENSTSWFVNGEKVSRQDFDREFNCFYALVDEVLAKKGYVFNHNNLYSFKSDKENEQRQYCDYLFSQEERDIYYFYAWKTVEELKDIINEPTSQTQTA